MEMITESDAQELLESPDLLAIGVRADDVRRTLHGARTTFVRDARGCAAGIGSAEDMRR